MCSISGFVLESQDTLVRPRALGIPDRCVDLLSSPDKDFHFLGREIIFVGGTSLQLLKYGF